MPEKSFKEISDLNDVVHLGSLKEYCGGNEEEAKSLYKKIFGDKFAPFNGRIYKVAKLNGKEKFTQIIKEKQVICRNSIANAIFDVVERRYGLFIKGNPTRNVNAFVNKPGSSITSFSGISEFKCLMAPVIDTKGDFEQKNALKEAITSDSLWVLFFISDYLDFPFHILVHKNDETFEDILKSPELSLESDIQFLRRLSSIDINGVKKSELTSLAKRREKEKDESLVPREWNGHEKVENDYEIINSTDSMSLSMDISKINMARLSKGIFISIAFHSETDEGDGNPVIIAPSSLLTPTSNTKYKIQSREDTVQNEYAYRSYGEFEISVYDKKFRIPKGYCEVFTALISEESSIIDDKMTDSLKEYFNKSHGDHLNEMVDRSPSIISEIVERMKIADRKKDFIISRRYYRST
jgi:hypothetical protein